MTRDSDHGTSRIDRTELLQNVEGVGIASPDRLASGVPTPETSLTYVDVVLTHDLSEEYVGTPVDRAAHRSVDHEEGTVYFPVATRGLEKQCNRADVLVDGRRPQTLPAKLFQSDVPGLITVGTEEYQPKRTLPTGDEYHPPSLRVEREASDTLVATAVSPTGGQSSSEELVIDLNDPGEKALTLPSVTVSVERAYRQSPADRERGASNYDDERIEVTPRFEFFNHGELDVYTGEVVEG